MRSEMINASRERNTRATSRTSIARQQFPRDLGQRKQVLVFFRKQRRSCSPRDVQVRIVEGDAVLVRAIVKIAAFVEELHARRQRQKTVRETARHVKLIPLLRRQDNARPFAKMRRADANIHGHVERFAFDHAAELRLRAIELVMQDAQHALRGSRMVILNENIRDAEFGEFFLVIRFEKTAASVAARFEENLANAGQICVDALEACSSGRIHLRRFAGFGHRLAERRGSFRALRNITALYLPPATASWPGALPFFRYFAYHAR